VFCGDLYAILQVFCDVLRRVFCEGFVRDFRFAFCAVFFTKHKTHEHIEKHWETQIKSTIRWCIAGIFQEQEPKIATVLCKTKHLSQKICKTPQNTRKIVTK